jgi:UDP-N-acetylglucosamine 4,6-dehydratase/UDP-glucose 4-epimerase
MDTIAVTGATGYLGELLIEHLVSEGKKVHAIARNEGKLTGLKEKFPSVRIFPCPVEDAFLLRKAVHECNGVFHLAAFKDVGLAEQHALKTVQTNILGTMNLLQLTLEYPNIRFVVGAGTDKAGTISGVYGASRLVMEKLFDEYRVINPYSCLMRVIRFGNILNSTSSVIVKWREALQRGQDIVLTDPEATRFFLTREEALRAMFNCMNAQSDEPYIPEMKAMRMQDLLDIMLDKYASGNKAKVRTIGLQKGENLHETGLNGLSSNAADQWTREELLQHI